MKYGLIVKKLNIIEEKFITSDEIKKYCAILNMRYLDVIKYLTRHKYLHVILRGIFYNPGIGERKLGLKIDHREAIAKALEIKGVKNWYFGLETAIKFHNLTHEFFVMDFIINDAIGRKKPITVFGHKIRMIKVKPELFFGIKRSKGLNYSDVEKTVLDIIYLKRYAGIKSEAIADYIMPLLEHCSKERLGKYAKRYNKKIEGFIRSL